MRQLICLLLLLGASLLCAPGLRAADWPQFRGPNATGITVESGLNTAWTRKAPRVLWKAPMHDNGFAGPSAAGGKVFIVDHQGSQDIVRALDLRTGKPLWQYAYADASRDNYGFTRCTPTVSSGKVYVLSRQGLLHCLDAASGRKVWARDLVADFGGKRPQWDFAISPLADGRKLIVCPGGANAAVAALDAATGKTIWKGGGSDVPGYATPVKATINGKAQYVVFTGKRLIGVDAGNGALLWAFPWQTKFDVNAATPIVIGNSVFITSGYGRGCALVQVAGSKATLKWTNTEIQSHFSTPIYAGGYLYGTTDPGKLVCLDVKTGKPRWTQPGFEKGGQIAVGNTLILLDGRRGDLVAVKLSPTGYEEVGRTMPLGGQSWTAPVLADGKLLIRNKGTLACLDLR